MARHTKSNKDKILSQTRQRLLDAAAEAFASLGFDRANINHISKAAGFAAGTIYNYFPSKRDLMQAFIEDISGKHVSFIAQQVRAQEEPAPRLQAFFSAGFDFVRMHQMPSRAIFNTLNGPDMDFKEKLYTAYQPLFDLVGSEILAPGIQRGDFRAQDISAATGLLMTIYLGTASQINPQGKHWLDPLQVADFVLRSLQNGAQQTMEEVI